MKLFAIAAAGLVALTGLAPAALTASANAQERVVVRERTVTHARPGYRHRATTRRVCTNRWRHGHRERVCRTVRYRR